MRLIYIKKIVFCLCLFLYSALTSFAANHSLMGIDVEQTSDKNYNVILKSDSNVKVKKSVSSPDNLMLVLQSTKPSDVVEIVYDNTSNVNNVMVQKKNKDNTIVLLEGKNISNADIFIKNISNGIIHPANKDMLFSGINGKMFLFSLSALLVWFLAIMSIKPKHKKAVIKNSNVIYKRKSPSIAYNRTAGNYISAPKDFIINRYMEDEKIRKAG